MGDKQAAARLAAQRRTNKKQSDGMNQYYAVVGFFVAVVAISCLYVLLNPKANFNEMPVNDGSAILVHNGQNHAYTQQVNPFFENWTLAEAKKLFEQAIADSPNIKECRSKENEDELPDQFDWRTENPDCSKDAPLSDHDCPANYVLATQAAVEDRLCKAMGRQVNLSSAEVTDCDKGNKGCDGGYVTKVLDWGRAMGFVEDHCHQKGDSCPLDNATTNKCRVENDYYRVIDHCLATEIDGIKREILANGPVIAQMTPFTDLLTYSEGIYHRTSDAFKFQGNLIVKVLGWDRSAEGDFWIVQNTWGKEWGEDGYARVMQGSGDSMLDMYAVGLAVYPFNQAELLVQQELAMQQQMQAEQEGQTIDFDNLGDYLDLDNSEEIVDMDADVQFEDLVDSGDL